MKHTAIALAIVSLMTAVPALAEPVITLRLNGAVTNRMNIAVLGDGYTATELNKYAADVDRLIDGIFLREPFKEYSSYFNVYRIDVTSNESGVDHPEWKQFKDTSLGTWYNCGDQPQCIAYDTDLVLGVLSRSTLPADLDLVMILVNDSTYGGIGGRFAVASNHWSVVDLMLHEAAHTFGHLADEYEEGSGAQCRNRNEPPQSNATWQTDRSQIKWRHWIDEDTPVPTTTLTPAAPGLYAGGNHCPQQFRPTFNSKMRSINSPFEQINIEQLVRSFYNFVSPIETTTPASAELQVKRGQPAGFAITKPQPVSHDMSVMWAIDGRAIGSLDGVSIDTTGMAAGRYTVEVAVRDSTPWVRHDPNEALVERRRWTLEITQ